ncbi:SRV-1 protein [Aphelenchoides avenae]|nr:SRV-1 protein [Aphelenchus avenae]
MVAHSILFVEATVDAIFLALHISVIVFLLRARGRDPVLRNGFYDIFILVSIADCVLLTATTIFYRVPNMGVATNFFTETCTVCPWLINHLQNYLVVVQAIGHTLIALNRFSCFHFEMLHEKLWKAWRIRVMLGLTVLLPFLVMVPRFVSGVSYVVYELELVDAAYDVDVFNMVQTVTDTSAYVIFSSAHLLLSIASFYAMYRLKESGKLDHARRNQDVQLLAHSLLMFLLQVYQTIGFLAASSLIPPSALTSFIFTNWRYFLDAFCLIGSPALLLLSAHVRTKYAEFYRLAPAFRRSKQSTVTVAACTF